MKNDIDDGHHRGLGADLAQWVQRAAQRRDTLRWLAAGGLAWGLQGCGGGGAEGAGAAANPGAATGTGTGVGANPGSGGTSVANCSVIPEETAGPFPGDGSNSSAGGIANALALSGILRSDIRASVGGAQGLAAGTPLSLKIQLVDAASGCANLAGYAVYLWHCDALGRYSMYSSGVVAENYLRGVQVTGSDGVATFTTIFPGCYPGRVPHMHFEVYRSAALATRHTNKIKTSQIAFPTAISSAVYAAGGYASSVAPFAAISFASDNVFSDGVTNQMATVSGSVAGADLQATLVVGVTG